MRKRCLQWLVCGALFGLACSTSRDPSEFFVPTAVGTLVVDGMLTVGRPLPLITLTRALAPTSEYSLQAAVVRGAMMYVRSLPDGEFFDYAYDSIPGAYKPVRLPGGRVRPRTTYELTVLTTRGELLTSSTTTPDSFAIASWVLLDDLGQAVLRTFATYASAGDSVYAQNQVVYADGLLEARFARPNVPAFEVGIFSLDLDSDFAIEPEFFEQQDFDDLDRQTSSPALEGRDGTLRLPWLAVFFQGRYKLRILALDRNAFDLVRSTPQDNGGFAFGGNLGGSFERPIFNVEGGIGLFGSASTDSVGFFVLPRP